MHARVHSNRSWVISMSLTDYSEFTTCKWMFLGYVFILRVFRRWLIWWSAYSHTLNSFLLIDGHFLQIWYCWLYFVFVSYQLGTRIEYVNCIHNKLAIKVKLIFWHFPHKIWDSGPSPVHLYQYWYLVMCEVKHMQ